MTQIAVLQPTITQSPIGICPADGNVVINPKRNVLPEAPRTDDREGVWSKKVRARGKSVLHDGTGRLFAVESKVTLVPERNWHVSRNLTRIDRARERFLLRLRAQQHRRFLYKYLVILRELESVFLERLSEVIQFRVVIVARRARRLVLPRKRGDGGSLRD